MFKDVSRLNSLNVPMRKLGWRLKNGCSNPGATASASRLKNKRYLRPRDISKAAIPIPAMAMVDGSGTMV